MRSVKRRVVEDISIKGSLFCVDGAQLVGKLREIFDDQCLSDLQGEEVVKECLYELPERFTLDFDSGGF